MTAQAATLLLTHPAPDLDAIGFVYSARKVWGAEMPAACRAPTRAELEDPAVIVGGIGLPGCEAIGHHNPESRPCPAATNHPSPSC